MLPIVEEQFRVDSAGCLSEHFTPGAEAVHEVVEHCPLPDAPCHHAKHDSGLHTEEGGGEERMSKSEGGMKDKEDIELSEIIDPQQQNSDTIPLTQSTSSNSSPSRVCNCHSHFII